MEVFGPFLLWINTIILTMLLLLEMEARKRMFGCERTSESQVSYFMRMFFTFLSYCVQSIVCYF